MKKELPLVLQTPEPKINDDFGDFDDSDESESEESSSESDSFRFFSVSLKHREDDTALLMKELERVKKEKELAKQKEVIFVLFLNDRTRKKRRWRQRSTARR